MNKHIFLYGSLIVLTAAVFIACPMEEKEPDFTSGDVIPLTLDIEAPGAINESNGEQWFKFTATTSTQYITIRYDTLTSVYIQLYNESGSTVGSQEYCFKDPPYGGTYFTRSVTKGNVYYIKVRPASGTGTYRLLFSNSPLTLEARNEATVLFSNSWTDGTSTSGKSQLFKFTANALTQYIYIKPGTLTDMMVRIYDSAGFIHGGQENDIRLTANKDTGYFWIKTTLTSGQVYYVSVWPYSSSYSGTGKYHITFSSSNTVPTPIPD